MISSTLIAFGKAGQGLPGFEAAMNELAAAVLAIQTLINNAVGTTAAG